MAIVSGHVKRVVSFLLMNFFIAKREACIAACQRALVDLATAQQTIHLVRIPSESASVSTGRLCARVINSFCGGCFTPLVCCRITLCVVCHFGSVCHLPLHLSFLQLLPLLFFSLCAAWFRAIDVRSSSSTLKLVREA